ncbi:hypothetical protein OS493_024332 [Desmophyllum pertusum]|uniref:Uncharacterized protein n=1 Tax=Desmophyllum pertusum TaxID=174260 RepID=A0A9X0CKX4_9CNID|nr:hypothetical protein OS493_024332 [Desmophyllum pertusum]
MQVFEQTQRDGECDSCGLLFNDKSTNTLVGDTLYQLQFVTSPNEGYYEASVKLKKGVPSLAGDVSRIDAYNDQPYCIAEKFPPLRNIQQFIKDLGKLQCTGERFSTFINNVLEVKGDGIASVQYRTIERPSGDDFKVVLSDPKSLSNTAKRTDENADTGPFQRFWNAVLDL